MAGFTVTHRGIDAERPGRGLPQPLAPGPSASGSSDDSAVLQSFLNGLPSGYGALLTQPYKLANPVSVPANISILGQGPGAQIQCTGNNFAFQVTSHNRISGLYLNASATQAAGGGFDFTNLGSDVNIDSLLIGNGLFYTFNIRPSNAGRGIVQIERVRFNAVTGHNVPFKIGDGTNLVTDLLISHIIGTAATNADVAKWWEILNNVDTLFVHDCDFFQGTVGVALGQVATGSVTASKWARVSIDTMATSGLVINKCRSLDWTDCTLSTIGTSGTSPGIQIAANAVGVNIKGGLVQNCRSDGIDIQAGAVYTDLIGVQVSDNNQGGAAFGAGIAVSANTNEFNIVSCRSGNFLLGGSVQQRGIWVTAGTSNFYTLVNNRTPNNSTSGLIDGGSGVNKTVSGNL